MSGWGEDTVRESLLIEANGRIRDLEAALRVQWEFNHDEHCGGGDAHYEPGYKAAPGEVGCHWPLPLELGGDPEDYRTYAPTGELPIHWPSEEALQAARDRAGYVIGIKTEADVPVAHRLVDIEAETYVCTGDDWVIHPPAAGWDDPDEPARLFQAHVADSNRGQLPSDSSGPAGPDA